MTITITEEDSAFQRDKEVMLIVNNMDPITKSTTAVIDYIYYDYTTTMVFATENHRGMCNRGIIYLRVVNIFTRGNYINTW